jgi:hypothetical protein
MHFLQYLINPTILPQYFTNIQYNDYTEKYIEVNELYLFV